MILQKIAIDANEASQSTQSRLVKLLSNVATQAQAKQTAEPKPPSRRSKHKNAQQNSSSLEHRRDSNLRRPQSRD